MLQSTSYQILNYVNDAPSSLQFCLWLHSLACSLSQIHKQYGTRQKLTVQGKRARRWPLQHETGMIFSFLNRICQQPLEDLLQGSFCLMLHTRTVKIQSMELMYLDEGTLTQSQGSSQPAAQNTGFLLGQDTWKGKLAWKVSGSLIPSLPLYHTTWGATRIKNKSGWPMNILKYSLVLHYTIYRHGLQEVELFLYISKQYHCCSIRKSHWLSKIIFQQITKGLLKNNWL